MIFPDNALREPTDFDADAARIGELKFFAGPANEEARRDFRRFRIDRQTRAADAARLAGDKIDLIFENFLRV